MRSGTSPSSIVTGGADGLWTGEHSQDRAGLPGASSRRRTSGGLPHLVGRIPTGFLSGERRADRECAGPAFLGRRSWPGGTMPPRLPVRLATRLTVTAGAATPPCRCLVRQYKASGDIPAFQQGAGWSPCGGRGGSSGHRHASRGAGCLRARDQCRQRSASVSTHPRP